MNKLKQYFPVIREKTELIQSIRENEYMSAVFDSWDEEQQEEFINMCCGIKGVKILYDVFFKEIMNPEYAPERLNEFLSLLLKTEIKIRAVLPNDSTRITDECSLLITDIVVELEDGSLANVEVQKIGYLFPGQRCACYSADLLLRQYRRIRSGKKKKFSYKDIKSVYTIVLFEKSPDEFKKHPDIFRHYFEQKADTGLSLELLQKYIFVPLDIFLKKLHNKGISSKYEAWLAFLASDDPDIIIRLIEEWPEFRPMYEEIYNMCRNIEGVMEMFSKELQELDRNTVQYMIDEMQEALNRQNKELQEIRQKKAEAEQEKEQEKRRAEQEKVRIEKEKERAEQEKEKAEQKAAEAYQRIAELEALLQNSQRIIE